jgi:hypothetical protein
MIEMEDSILHSLGSYRLEERKTSSAFNEEWYFEGGRKYSRNRVIEAVI